MIKNYLLTALRNIQRHKGYSFINIAGLAIGMACCLLILIFIMTELSYDRFHSRADRIYRLGLNAVMGERIIHMPISNNPTAKVLLEDYPEVDNAVRIRPWRRRSCRPGICRYPGPAAAVPGPNNDRDIVPPKVP